MFNADADRRLQTPIYFTNVFQSSAALCSDKTKAAQCAKSFIMHFIACYSCKIHIEIFVYDAFRRRVHSQQLIWTVKNRQGKVTFPSCQSWKPGKMVSRAIAPVRVCSRGRLRRCLKQVPLYRSANLSCNIGCRSQYQKNGGSRCCVSVSVPN